MLKVKTNLAPKKMNEVSDFLECQYRLRNELRFKSRNIRIVRYIIEIAAFVTSRISTNMPNELKESTSLKKCKSKIKKTWKPEIAHANSVKSTFRELVTF